MRRGGRPRPRRSQRGGRTCFKAARLDVCGNSDLSNSTLFCNGGGGGVIYCSPVICSRRLTPGNRIVSFSPKAPDLFTAAKFSLCLSKLVCDLEQRRGPLPLSPVGLKSAGGGGGSPVAQLHPPRSRVPTRSAPGPTHLPNCECVNPGRVRALCSPRCLCCPDNTVQL